MRRTFDNNLGVASSVPCHTTYLRVGSEGKTNFDGVLRDFSVRVGRCLEGLWDDWLVDLNAKFI